MENLSDSPNVITFSYINEKGKWVAKVTEDSVHKQWRFNIYEKKNHPISCQPKWKSFLLQKLHFENNRILSEKDALFFGFL